MRYEHITVPPQGARIAVNADGSLNVPDRPIIPFIEGDGIGIDITPVMRKVVDAAVERAYGGARRIEWMEVYAGEKANRVCGTWFPDETRRRCASSWCPSRGRSGRRSAVASAPSMS